MCNGNDERNKKSDTCIDIIYAETKWYISKNTFGIVFVVSESSDCIPVLRILEKYMKIRKIDFVSEDFIFSLYQF